MSFLNPAPINNDEITKEFKDYIDKGTRGTNMKSRLKKTLKRRKDVKNTKVDDFLNSLVDDSSDSENEDLGNLNPLPNPILQTTKEQPRSNFDDVSSEKPEYNKDMLDSAVSKEQFKSMESNYNNQYVSNYVPYSTNAANTQEIHGSKDLLLEKLNYMIELLEEQQEEKTGHVTEELILYCFLGVFMIFVVDSFARVGKYVR